MGCVNKLLAQNATFAGESIVNEQSQAPQTVMRVHKAQQRKLVPFIALAGLYPETAARREFVILPEIAPNRKCPCGSGKKFKKCCRNGIKAEN